MSHAEGSYAIASGYTSHAEGFETIANGEAAHAEGYISKALYDYAHAEGEETIAYGYGAHAEGEYTAATNDAAHAEGGGWTRNFTLSGSDCEYTIESGSTNGLIVGNVIVYKNMVTKVDELDLDNSLLFTYDDLGTLENEEVLIFLAGYASEYTAHAEGDCTIASGYASHAEGESTIASEDATHAEGSSTKALYFAAHAEGNDNVAAYFADHAEGSTTLAAGGASHAEGDCSITFGYASHAEGESVAIGDYSHSEGCVTLTIGDYSHSEGEGNTIYVQNDIVKISNNVYQLDQSYDIKVGDIVVVNNQEDIFGCAEVVEYDPENLTITIGRTSGNSSFYAGDYDTWEGTQFHRNAIAFGDYSHIEGKETIAYGNYAHAQGIGTIAPQSNMDVIGRFNDFKYSYEKTTATNTSIVLSDFYHIDDFIFNPELGKFTPVNKSSVSSDHTNTIIGDLYVKGASDQDGYYSTIYEVIGPPKYNTPPYGASPYYSIPCQRYYADSTAEGAYAHIIGNGTSNEDRSNAHTVDWDGNAQFAGNIKIGGTGYDDPNAQLITGGGGSSDINEPKDYFILNSSTPGSSKQFKITIDDDGVLTATELVV